MIDRLKAREVPVEAGDHAAVLERDRGDHGVGKEISCRVGLFADPAQQREMARAGGEQQVVGLRAHAVQEREGLGQGCRGVEDAPARGESRIS